MPWIPVGHIVSFDTSKDLPVLVLVRHPTSFLLERSHPFQFPPQNKSPSHVPTFYKSFDLTLLLVVGCFLASC